MISAGPTAVSPAEERLRALLHQAARQLHEGRLQVQLLFSKEEYPEAVLDQERGEEAVVEHVFPERDDNQLLRTDLDLRDIAMLLNEPRRALGAGGNLHVQHNRLPDLLHHL